jgi:hypothetical protein
MIFVPYRKHTYVPPQPLDSFTYIYIYVRTSQETRLWAPTVSYGDSFTFIHVDDVRTSQETCLRACYRDSSTFYM